MSISKLNKKKINPVSARPRKWSNTLKQFVGNLPTNCLSVFDHFLGLALKGFRCANIIQNQLLHGGLLHCKTKNIRFCPYMGIYDSVLIRENT